MPGFFVSNYNIDTFINNVNNTHCVYETIQGIDNYIIKRNTLNKFMNDKAFYETEKYIIIIEGVILNKKELCRGISWEKTLESMIDKEEYLYFDRFRGSFSGAHYNKQKKEWVFYTDHTESKPLFYYCCEGRFIVASNLNYITDTLKQLNIKYNFDENYAYCMLTYGYMVSETTPIEEIKKLSYGKYLIFSPNNMSSYTYYTFSNYSQKYDNYSDTELIEIWDKLFRKAIQLEYEKDQEYGYISYTSLSGGVDSRMNTWVAKELGFDKLLNICFTQSDYYDETIAKEVSQKLGTELFVKSLNGGDFLLDFRSIIEMNYGMTLYSGVAHSNSVDKFLNFELLGLIHTGQLGGVNSPSPVNCILEGAYSQKLANRVKGEYRKPKDIDFETFRVNNREFRGNICSQIALTNYTECISPFQYKEFFDFYYELPFSKRDGDYLYFKWICSKYPEAAKIPVERLYNGYLTDSKFIQRIRLVKMYGVRTTFHWLLWKIGILKEIDKRLLDNHMNPYDKWFRENKRLRSSMDSFFDDSIEWINSNNVISKQLSEDMLELYKTGTVGEKTQVITVLAVLELFWS